MTNLLFVCSQNRLRSPTAEAVFASYANVTTASAGISSGADNPVTPELILWSDVIFVMEHVHKRKLSAKHSKHLRNKRVVVLGIPDNYEYMEPDLVLLLTQKVVRHLPALNRAEPNNDNVAAIKQ